MLRQIKDFSYLFFLSASILSCDDDANNNEFSIPEEVNVTYLVGLCCSHFELAEEMKISTLKYEYNTKYLDVANIETIVMDFQLQDGDKIHIKFEVLEDRLPCHTLCLQDKASIPIRVDFVEK